MSEKEIRRLQAQRRRLNIKYIQLGNDNYVYDSPQIQDILKEIDLLDHQIAELKWRF